MKKPIIYSKNNVVTFITSVMTSLFVRVHSHFPMHNMGRYPPDMYWL